VSAPRRAESPGGGDHVAQGGRAFGVVADPQVGRVDGLERAPEVPLDLLGGRDAGRVDVVDTGTDAVLVVGVAQVGGRVSTPRALASAYSASGLGRASSASRNRVSGPIPGTM